MYFEQILKIKSCASASSSSSSSSSSIPQDLRRPVWLSRTTAPDSLWAIDISINEKDLNGTQARRRMLQSCQEILQTVYFDLYIEVIAKVVIKFLGGTGNSFHDLKRDKHSRLDAGNANTCSWIRREDD